MWRWRLLAAPVLTLVLLLAVVAPAAAQQTSGGRAYGQPQTTMTQPRRGTPSRTTTARRPTTTTRRATTGVRAARTGDLDPNAAAAGLGVLSSAALGGGLLLRRRTPGLAV